MKLKNTLPFLLGLLSSFQANSQVPFNFFSSDMVGRDAGISAGAAAGDFNNDGFPDLFVANMGQDNFLYKNNGDGSFTKYSDTDVVTDKGYSSGGVWGDVDNDGDLDLFVANQRNENNFFYLNDGSGNFVRVMEGDHVTDHGASYTAIFVDFNVDGLLDLYVVNSHGQNDFVYRNIGDGRFERAFDTGLGFDGATNWGASFVDMDGDGAPDFYLPVRDGGTDRIFRNDGKGHFTEVLNPTINNRSTDSNSATFGDFDNDGDQDMFIANGTDQENELYINNGNFNFSKTANDVIQFDKHDSCLGAWGDFNNDGFLDIFIMNYGQYNELYLSDRGKKFIKDTTSFIVNIASFGSGLSLLDVENDGDLDLFFANWENQNNKLYINNIAGKNWIRIKCKGRTSTASGIGTKVSIITSKTEIQTRQVFSDLGRRSQSDIVQHFGLGNNQIIDLIIVNWPGGAIDSVINQQVNQTLVVEEGSGLVGKMVNPSTVMRNYLIELVTRYNEDPTIKILKMEISNLLNNNQLTANMIVRFARYVDNKGDTKGALDVLKLAMEKFPEEVEIHVWQGSFLKKEGRINEAVSALEAGLELAKEQNTNSDIINNLEYELKEIAYTKKK